MGSFVNLPADSCNYQYYTLAYVLVLLVLFIARPPAPLQDSEVYKHMNTTRTHRRHRQRDAFRCRDVGTCRPRISCLIKDSIKHSIRGSLTLQYSLPVHPCLDICIPRSSVRTRNLRPSSSGTSTIRNTSSDCRYRFKSRELELNCW